MGACLSKQEDLFDKLVLESIFLDFLIRNIEVDNDWEGSAEAIEDGLQFVSPDQLTKMDYDGNLIAVPSTDTNVTVALISDSTQKATYCLKRGNAFMYAPYHSINQTVSITFSNSNNKSKTIIVGNRKHLLATFASVNKTKGKTLSQLETCVSTPLGDVLKTNSIFADLGVQEYDFIQPFIHWRYIERNSKVFSVEPYEDLDLVLGMHILVDGSCVILDDPKEPGGVSSEGNSGKQPRGNAANKRPSNKTGQLLVDTPDASPDPSACATEVRMIRTEAVESPLPIPSQDINKTDAINNNGPPSPAQQVSAASSAADPPSATGDQDLKAMITDVLSLKDVSADEGSPQQPHNSSPKRQSDTGGKGKKKPHSHIHRGPLHACFHSLTRCLPCFGGKASNIVYAADGTINYHGMKLGIQKEENNSLNNSIYAASVYTGESEYVAYGATSGLSPVTPTGSKGLFSGFSQKNNNADLKFKRLSSKKVIGGPAANHAGGHQKAVREQDPMSFQGRIPNVGNIYNKGSVLGPELSLIKNNVVQMSRIETLERSVFAVLTPSSLDRIEESGQMGESIVRSLRRNWRVKLLHKLKKTVPFLCDINHSEMAVLAKKVTLHTFTAPDVIYTQGDTSNMFYIVVHGHVGIYQVPVERTKKLQEANERHKSSHSKLVVSTLSVGNRSPGGSEAPMNVCVSTDASSRKQSISCLRTISNGGYFGEISLVAGRERVATAIATPGTILLGMNKNTFLDLFMQRRTILTELRLKLLPIDAPVPLILVLQHSRGYQLLLRFLKKELAQENILFWKEVDRLEEYIRSKIRGLRSFLPETGHDDSVRDFEAVSVSDMKVKVVELHRPLMIIGERIGQIVDKFVHTNAPLQINIPDGICKEIQSNYAAYFSDGMSAQQASMKHPPVGDLILEEDVSFAKLSPRGQNIANITKILVSRSGSVLLSAEDHTDKKRHECMSGEVKEQSLEQKEHEQEELAKSQHDTDIHESSEMIPITQMADLLEMLLQLFTRAKREVLLMLQHDGYKRWQDTDAYSDFRALITPYVGVPEGHIRQIAENTKEMFVQVTDS